MRKCFVFQENYGLKQFSLCFVFSVLFKFIILGKDDNESQKVRRNRSVGTKGRGTKINLLINNKKSLYLYRIS